MRRLFVFSTIALLLAPTATWAKGPIVRTSLDWAYVMWTILINNT